MTFHNHYGVVLFLSLFATNASAGPIAYAIAPPPLSGTDNLYLVDLGSASKTLIGPTGVGLTGLALSPSGQLFGLGVDINHTLYSINAATGAATAIGPTLVFGSNLRFDGNTLETMTFGNLTSFTSLDPTTGLGTGSTGVFNLANSDAPEGLAFQNSSTAFFFGFHNNPTETLYSYNFSTGLASIGSIAGGNVGIFGLDFASDGQLYGLDSAGNVYRINPSNAAASLVGNTGNDFWVDAVAIPTPEPASMGLVAAGLVIAAFVTRRRR